MRGGYSFDWQCSRMSTRDAVGGDFFFYPEKLNFKSHKRKWQSTALQLSILGGYSHVPISLSSARQTHHRPDKHNHSRHRFTEHLSAGKKQKKVLHTHSVKHLFALNTQLSAAHYQVMIVLQKSLSSASMTESTEWPMFIWQAGDSKRIIDAIWFELILISDVLHEKQKLILRHIIITVTLLLPNLQV